MLRYRTLSSSITANNNTTNTTTNSFTGLFGESTSKHERASGYSRNDRPAASNQTKNKNNKYSDDEKYTVTLMLALLVTCMVLYIVFCIFYQRKRVTDRDGTAGGSSSRREQLRENQDVIDESVRATRRALLNSDAMIKYKQRKLDIEKALFIRLVVDKNDIIGTTTTSWVPKQSSADDLKSVAIPAHGDDAPEEEVTMGDSDDEEENTGSSDSTPALPPSTLLFSPTCSSISTPSASSSSRQQPFTLNSHAITTLSSSTDSKYDEECNICLNQFQVGDFVAWNMQYVSAKSKKLNGTTTTVTEHAISSCSSPPSAKNNCNDECKHVFHEECISRWLLVRDGCPTCRRSYFPSTVVVAIPASTSTLGE